MARFLLLCLILVFFLLDSVAFGKKIKKDPFDTVCKDENDNPVDWYILYKFPAGKRRHDGELFSKGLAYGYVTSEHNKFNVSDYAIDDERSMLVNTLKPIYQADDKKTKIYSTPLAYTMWSDQTPAGGPIPNSARGHSKGVILMNLDTGRGAWLSHSTPLYPQQRKAAFPYYPMTALRNAQTFLCVSFDANRYSEEIVEHIIAIKPIIYDSFFSKAFRDKNPAFQKFKNNEDYRGPKKLVQVIETLGGKEVDLIAKTRAYKTDIYSTVLSDMYGPLYVQTWRSGKGGKLYPTCERVYDISSFSLLDEEDDQEIITWFSGSDHSKWAVSMDDSTRHVVCVGDINRVESQFTRGGGTVCLEDEGAWFSMRSLIDTYEKCSAGKKFVSSWEDTDDAVVVADADDDSDPDWSNGSDDDESDVDTDDDSDTDFEDEELLVIDERKTNRRRRNPPRRAGR